MVYCSSGHPNEVGKRFCGECGELLRVPAPVALSSKVPSAPNEAEPGLAVPREVPPPDESAPALAKPGGGHKPLIAAGVVGCVVVAAVLVGFLVGGGSAAKHRLQGGLILFDTDTVQNGCSGTGGYADIEGGIDVQIHDEKGTLVASGELGQGRGMLRSDIPVGLPAAEVTNLEAATTSDGRSVICYFPFEMSSGLTNASQYELRFGDGHRGTSSHTHKEMVDDKWSIFVTLGT